MTISYPLAMPASGVVAITLMQRDVIGSGTSPFTLSTQVQRHPGQAWEADITLRPMFRDDAEEWIAFLSSLDGRFGTFLLRDGISGRPRGTWAGTPLVDGAHASLANVLAIKGLTVGATVKKGDFLQLGSGVTSRLHKIRNNATADGAGKLSVDIWPSVREALAGDEAIVTTNAVGTFRLAANTRRWDIDRGSVFDGFQFSAVEAL